MVVFAPAFLSVENKIELLFLFHVEDKGHLTTLVSHD